MARLSSCPPETSRHLQAARQAVLDARDSASERLGVAAATTTVRPAGTKILLMDDELSVRMALSRVLEKWGCRVCVAVDGQEAVAAYSFSISEGDPFDVVIFDLMNRHGIGGREALQEILRLDPSVHAIAMSGNPEHPALLDPVRFGFKGALEKPFDVMRLKETLVQAKGRKS